MRNTTMLQMSVSNPQIAIAGRVLEGETEKAISGAMVEIIEMPEKFKAILSLKALQYGKQWEKMSTRLDRKITASDGYFYFVDLPKGNYTLQAFVPGSETRYKNGEQKVSVSSPIKDIIPISIKDIVKEIIPTTITDIVLEPTGIKGKITDADEANKAIVNAKVQIQGSSESTFSDQKGNYRLLGLEASKSGQRTVTLIVSATDYQQKNLVSLVIKQGEISDHNFSLKQKL